MPMRAAVWRSMASEASSPLFCWSLLRSTTPGMRCMACCILGAHSARSARLSPCRVNWYWAALPRPPMRRRQCCPVPVHPAGRQSRRPCRVGKVGEIVALQGELVLGSTAASADAEVLHGLQEERAAGDVGSGAAADPGDHFIGGKNAVLP